MNRALAERIRAVVCRYSAVKLAYLFGSQATGNVGPLSDVDVAVYLDGLNRTDRFRLRLELMAELSGALQRNDVEVVVLNDARRPAFKYHVIADGVIVYEREPYRVQVEPSIVNEYLDFQALLGRHGLAGIRLARQTV